MRENKINLNFGTIDQNISKIILNHKVDLSSVGTIDLWSFVLIWLLLVEFSEKSDVILGSLVRLVLNYE